MFILVSLIINLNSYKMKSVIITGTSRGIGLETALAFAKAGYKVYATMRNAVTAAALERKWQVENIPILIREMDVDSDKSVHEVITSILDENGPVDVLVNNAGIEKHGTMEELTMVDFRSVMETNYFGVLRCIKAVLPAMRENNRGCIINVSSVAGDIACSPLGAYSASKFAVEAASEALAGEVKAFNIRVAIVKPGIINTDMAQAISVGNSSVYPQVKRFAGMFAASLKSPTPPSLVGQAILDIAESDSWQLRYAVGPDAAPFLGWRKGMSDEEWVDWSAMKDDEWYSAVETSFGMNARQE
jgi:NAD(P)-dependent dehydrogenase (short-subunit alcohol dehydrogenase family)